MIHSGGKEQSGTEGGQKYRYRGRAEISIKRASKLINYRWRSIRFFVCNRQRNSGQVAVINLNFEDCRNNAFELFFFWKISLFSHQNQKEALVISAATR